VVQQQRHDEEARDVVQWLDAHRATGRRRELPRRVAAAVPRARQLVLDVLERRADEHVDAARTLGIELLGHVDDGVALRVPRSRESR